MSRVCYLISIEFLRKKNLQPRLSLSIPTFSQLPFKHKSYQKTVSYETLQWRWSWNRSSTSKMAPLGNIPHLKNFDIGLEIIPTPLKTLPHFKKSWHWWFESPLVARVNTGSPQNYLPIFLVSELEKEVNEDISKREDSEKLVVWKWSLTTSQKVTLLL